MINRGLKHGSSRFIYLKNLYSSEEAPRHSLDVNIHAFHGGMDKCRLALKLIFVMRLKSAQSSGTFFPRCIPKDAVFLQAISLTSLFEVERPR